MPILVHLADEKDANKILNSGLKIGKHRAGIYAMPVLSNFYVSHQWLRELKRRGVKTYVGIYFKMDSKELVYAGRYGREHKHITLSEAIKEIMHTENPLGYELIINRKIEPSEIHKIKPLPQNVGWRYQPKSHNTKPCGCEFCQRGQIKSRKLREDYKSDF